MSICPLLWRNVQSNPNFRVVGMLCICWLVVWSTSHKNWHLVPQNLKLFSSVGIYILENLGWVHQIHSFHSCNNFSNSISNISVLIISIPFMTYQLDFPWNIVFVYGVAPPASLNLRFFHSERAVRLTANTALSESVSSSTHSRILRSCFFAYFHRQSIQNSVYFI